MFSAILRMRKSSIYIKMHFYDQVFYNIQKRYAVIYKMVLMPKLFNCLKSFWVQHAGIDF